MPPLRIAFVATVVALLAVACGGREGGGDGPAPSGFNGRFRAQTPNGPLVLTLATRGDTVDLSRDGESVSGRLVAPDRVEGSQADGSFVLTLSGDRLTAKFSVVDGDGNRHDLDPITLERVASPPAGARDPSLVGNWLHTESHSGGGLSMATDVHLELAADGTYASWSRSAGIGDTRTSERTTGAWKTEGGRLHLRPDADGAWFEKGAYAVSDAGLLLTYGPGNKQVFQRN
jgi:hypothetical protein